MPAVSGGSEFPGTTAIQAEVRGEDFLIPSEDARAELGGFIRTL